MSCCKDAAPARENSQPLLFKQLSSFMLLLINALLYCTVLHCTVLYCTVLHCTVLYCTVPVRQSCTCVNNTLETVCWFHHNSMVLVLHYAHTPAKMRLLQLRHCVVMFCPYIIKKQVYNWYRSITISRNWAWAPTHDVDYIRVSGHKQQHQYHRYK